jgi:hypothetical protein
MDVFHDTLAGRKLVFTDKLASAEGSNRDVVGITLPPSTKAFSPLAGWLYARFGPAGFWTMGVLCMAAFPFIWLLHRIPVPIPSNGRFWLPSRD